MADIFLGINPDAWKRLERLANLMLWDLGDALKHMALIWRVSQELKREAASAQDLARWGKVSRRNIARFLEQAEHEDVRFVKRRPDGLYEIRGNRKAIKRAAEHAERSSNGGNARAEKLRAAGASPVIMRSESCTPEHDIPFPEDGDFVDLSEKSLEKSPALGTAQDYKFIERHTGKKRITPCSPSRGEGRISRQAADQAFLELVELGLRRTEIPIDADPTKHVGPIAAGALEQRYGSLAELRQRLRRAASEGRLEMFEVEVRRACRAYARSRNAERRSQAPPQRAQPSSKRAESDTLSMQNVEE